MSESTDTITVERSAEVSAPPEQVFAAIADLHDWEDWSPWEGRDPAMRRTYGGAEKGVGATYEWQGNRKVGSGRMEITEATEPSDVVIDLRFLKPFKSENTTSFHLEPAGGSTRVTWRLVAPKTFMSRVMELFSSMDKMVGKDFEQGLDQLDAHLRD